MADESAHSKTNDKPAGKGRRSTASKVLLVVGILLLVAAVVDGAFILHKYRAGDQFYEGVHQAQLTTADASADPEGYVLDIDWAALQEQNTDIVAWVQIPGTVVDYPVVQTGDNDFYLTHDFAKESSSFGCIFLDFESAADFSDRNTILYGHHMRNGSMFATLIEYEDPGFLAEHPYVYVATPDGKTRCLKVFCLIVAGGDEMLRQTEFDCDEELQAYVQSMLDRNEIETDITADQVHHLYTLATCSYQFNDARTIVYAVEVDENGAVK